MKRKRSLKAIRRELDQVFSIIVRQRNLIGFDIAECVTCGMTAHWKYMHAGHFIPRQYLATRWDIRNCWPQCPKCNTFRHGALTEYTLFMQRTYGPEVVDELLQAKRQTVKLTREWLEERLNYFKTKL